MTRDRRKYFSEYYLTHKKQRQAYFKEYYKKNKDKIKARNNAKKKGIAHENNSL